MLDSFIETVNTCCSLHMGAFGMLLTFQVDSLRAQLDQQRRQEEQKELEELRQIQSKLVEEEVDKRLKEEVSKSKDPKSLVRKGQHASSSSSQSKLLKAVVKRRSNSKEDQKSGDAAQPPAKTAKLGALAGLGDYSSSSEEDS
jgi:hypothetical protein